MGGNEWEKVSGREWEIVNWSDCERRGVGESKRERATWRGWVGGSEWEKVSRKGWMGERASGKA